MSLKLVHTLNPSVFEETVDIMEEVYPGYKAQLSKLYDEHQFRHMTALMKKFIEDNGGYERLATFYNNADEQKKESVRNAFLKVFKPGTAFEDQVLMLDKAAKIKGVGLLTQLFGEVKDNIIMSSVNSGHRTLDEWHTFVRREHEAGNDIRLGILEVMEEQEKPTQESSTDIGHAQQLSDAQVAEVSPQPVIPEELRTEKAAKMFRKAISKGLCDECYHWKHSKVLLAYFADRASEYLQLSKAEQDGKKKVFWKPFETLFQVSGLSGARNTYTNKTGILPQNHKIVDAIFD
jgi:hypothetical protein